MLSIAPTASPQAVHSTGVGQAASGPPPSIFVRANKEMIHWLGQDGTVTLVKTRMLAEGKTIREDYEPGMQGKSPGKGQHELSTFVFEPREADQPSITVHVNSAGQGFGHRAPAEACVEGLVYGESNVRVVWDVNLPTHTFDRGPVDHGRYKYSNMGGISHLANKWRELYSATPQFKQVVARLEHLHNSEPIHYSLVNHRFVAHAWGEKAPANSPFGTLLPDHGKGHQGWYFPRLLGKRPGHELDRFFASNQIGANHARKHGVADEKIRVLGYPVRKAFEYWGQRPREEARQAAGIPEGKRVTSFSAGNARNPGKFVQELQGFLNHPDADNMHVVALAATNKELKADLERLNLPQLEVRGMQGPNEMAMLGRAIQLPTMQPGGGGIGEAYAVGAVPVYRGEKSGVEHANRKKSQRYQTGIVAFEPDSVSLRLRKSPAEIDKTNDALLKKAVYETSQAEIDRMVANQKQFKVIGASDSIAKHIVALARLNAGHGDEHDLAEAAAGQRAGSVQPTPATPSSRDATPTTPFSASVPSSPAERRSAPMGAQRHF